MEFSTIQDIDPEETESSYRVRLDSFTGPLDLLLHLIRKHEINIYDIPIALITQQYLEYLNLMKSLNLSLAGEFLVMAATLLHIKSRMLLPKDDLQEDDQEEGEDPREELVRRLLEYEQFKEAAGRLSYRERIWREVFRREPSVSDASPIETTDSVPTEELDLFDLLSALQEVLNRTPPTVLDVTVDTLSVQDRIHGILDRLESEPTLTFRSLFDRAVTRVMVIVTFLALLELVRMKLVRIYQSELFGPIHVARHFVPAAPPRLDDVEAVE